MIPSRPGQMPAQSDVAQKLRFKIDQTSRALNQVIMIVGDGLHHRFWPQKYPDPRAPAR
jgi:predicted AlkP superfamily pyrophosphatase or phosphodiesterase